MGKEIVTTSKSAKEVKMHEDMLGGKSKNKTADKSDNGTWR